MQKNGIALPKPPTGTSAQPGGGLLLGAGAQLPKGVTRAQYQAALSKCASRGLAGGGGAQSRGVNSAGLKQAFTKFAACLRQNGINIPPPNTSGKGPIFSTKGINPSSPQFKSATAKCRSVLVGAFRRTPNAGATQQGH